jgi:hypothetical protein
MEWRAEAKLLLGTVGYRWRAILDLLKLIEL